MLLNLDSWKIKSAIPITMSYNLQIKLSNNYTNEEVVGNVIKSKNISVMIWWRRHVITNWITQTFKCLISNVFRYR